MSETPPDVELPARDPGAAPQLQVVTQYVKDLSFENYNAPQSLMQEGEAPKVEVNANLEARNVGPLLFEVELSMTVTAERDESRLYLVEIVYGGLFRIQNVQPAALRAVCLIECPRMMFPFARRVIADTTRDGGFQPLLIDPLDFFRLYHERYGMPQDAGDDAGGDGSEGAGGNGSETPTA